MLLSGVGRPVGPLVLRNVSIEIAVLGNATCRKGYAGPPAGCVDYRPLDCQAAGSGRYCPDTPSSGVVLPQLTSGIRLEGAGTVHLESVSVSYKYSDGERPEWWAQTCVTNPILNASFDPWPYEQTFNMTGMPVKCSR